MIDEELLKQKDLILKARTRIKDQGRAGKRKLEREWYRNVLFLVGRQWIEWDANKGTWINATAPKWYEMPVTNKFAVAYNTIKTILTQEDPRIIVRPESDSEEDQATADVADMAVDVTDAEADMKKVKEIAASWVVCCNNVFLHNYYEVSESKYGSSFVVYEQCLQCQQISRPTDVEDAGGKCPKCGGEQFKPAVDQFLQPVGETVPKGKLCCEAVPPFEMYFNAEMQDFKEVPEAIRSKEVPVDSLKETYPDFADAIKPGTGGDSISKTYMKTLAYISTTGTQSVMSSAAAGGEKVETAPVDYMVCLPTTAFPDGLSATIIGDNIVELAPLKYAYGSGKQKDRKFINFVHIGNERLPGRVWHRGKMDDVAVKQIQRNKLESFILLWTYAMSGGKWLEPSGTNMDAPTGQPHQRLKFDMGPNGEKPELMKGLPVDQVLLALLEGMDKDIADLSASYDVLKGELPVGLKTASGLRMLTERGFSRHNEMIHNWERGLEESKIQQIEIARAFFDEERSKTFENDLGNWETKTFTKADLQGGINIRVEPGSTLPKSKAMEDEEISHSIEEGVIDPTNPKVNFKILEKRGQTDLSSGVGEDIKDAAHEWKDFLDSVIALPQGPPEKWKLRPRLGIDNEQVHYMDAVSRAKTDEFFNMPIEAQNLWIEHAQIHKLNIQAEMMQQAAMSAPPQKPGANGKPEMNGKGPKPGPSTLAPQPVNAGAVE